MKTTFLVLALILGSATMCAFTGFGESNTFTIAENTLPVELSTFTVSLTATGMAQLSWVSQSETNLNGYYVYRADTNAIGNAILVSGLINATNTSSEYRYEFTDEEILEAGTYYYWLNSLDLDGSEAYHGPVSILINLGSDPGIPEIPLLTGLKSIYPNPFNPSATIAYQLKSPATVKIEVFNARGQLVKTHQTAHDAAGQYSWLFEGTDARGKALSSGVYQVVMRSGKTISSQKMVLLK